MHRATLDACEYRHCTLFVWRRVQSPQPRTVVMQVRRVRADALSHE